MKKIKPRRRYTKNLRRTP
uniref:Uncharacterized protein n=1 Tax=Rhizophora mucronata TaxID=61149 RepID=A0A2P2NPI5_RHIMU